MGLFEAKNINVEKLEPEQSIQQSSSYGKGFAASGGVAKAVVKVIQKMAPEREIHTVNAEGLSECKKMLMLAKAGKYNGYLLEGMACPGGCVGGAGTLAPIQKATAAVMQSTREGTTAHSTQSKYSHLLASLEE